MKYPTLQDIKDVILILASFSSILLSLYSLKKWKNELNGKIKYETARNLLQLTYDLRDEFKFLRSPFIMSYESNGELPNTNLKKSEYYYRVIEQRVKRFNKSYNAFLSIQPEVEVDLGDKVVSLCKEVMKHKSKYQFKLDEFLRLIDFEDKPKGSRIEKSRNVIFDVSTDNPTTKSFNASIKKLETQLKKELR